MRVSITMPGTELALGRWPLSLKAKKRVRAWGRVTRGILAVAETPGWAAGHVCPLPWCSAGAWAAQRRRPAILGAGVWQSRSPVQGPSARLWCGNSHTRLV